VIQKSGLIKQTVLKPNTKWVGRICFRFALQSFNKIVQELPALLLAGIYRHDAPNCGYDCGHLTAVLTL
jgi:hypothetical protein